MRNVRIVVGYFSFAIILGCCIGWGAKTLSSRPCDHHGCEWDVTFARTSTGTLIWNVNSPELTEHKIYYPADGGYIKACEYFEPYMLYAKTLSHNRGRSATFCERCFPFKEDSI